jgi:ribonuclease Z
MLQAGIKRSRIANILISHFDIDHFSGLIGLLSTLQLQRREEALRIVAPAGIREYVEWNLNFTGTKLSYELEYVEIQEDIDEMRVVDEEEYFIEARPLNHTIFCVGYRFQEKDKPGKVDADKAEKFGIMEDAHFKALKAGEDVTLEDGRVIKSYDIVGHPRPGDSFAYITDTRYCPNSVKLAMNTNILYHESTFSSELAEKAYETGHSTAADAARVATESQTKLLVIAHFSARYTNSFLLLKEAREKFFPAWLATELRPIFTDPAQEKGVIKQRVFLKEIDEQQQGNDTNKKNDSPKRMRKRKKPAEGMKPRKRRPASTHTTGRSSSDQSSGRQNYRDRDNSSDYQTRKPKHITPRTPFDDFDRF